MTVLGKVAVEERPTTIATFIHVVASHQELWREQWNLLSVLELQSLLGNLGETHSVAGTAVALVSVFVGEINTTDSSPVEVGWKLAVWDFFCRSVLLVLSGLIPCFLELWAFAECFLSSILTLSLA